MSMMENLRKLFQRPEVPEETREIFLKAANTLELLKGLELVRGKNEVELREKEQELIALERLLLKEEDQIRRGGLTRLEETICLRRIERLEKQRKGLENLVAIYNSNVNLHLNLIIKIQEMEAMRAQGVDEDQIDRLAQEVEENLGRYRHVRLAGEETTPALREEQDEEEQRLTDLKRRIIGTTAAPAKRNAQERKMPEVE